MGFSDQLVALLPARLWKQDMSVEKPSGAHMHHLADALGEVHKDVAGVWTLNSHHL